MKILELIEAMEDKGDGLSESAIQAALGTVGIKMPDAYRRFLSQANGGYLGGRARLSITRVDGTLFETPVEGFLGFRDDEECLSIEFFHDNEESLDPSQHLAFASDCFGNCFAMSTTGEDCGNVFFVNHEACCGESFLHVAKTFVEFIGALSMQE